MGNEKINIKESLEVPADARLPTKYGEFRIRVFHEFSCIFWDEI